MEGQDHKASAGIQTVKGGIKALRKLIQLAVHGNAQRLEHPFGGVPALSAGGSRYRCVDQVDQLTGAGKGFLFPCRGNALGNG